MRAAPRFGKISDGHWRVLDAEGNPVGEVRRFRPGWWPFKPGVPLGKAGPFRPARTRAEAARQLVEVETPEADEVERLRVDAVEHLESARRCIDEARALVRPEAEPFLLWWPTVALAAVEGAISSATPMPLTRLRTGR